MPHRRKTRKTRKTKNRKTRYRRKHRGGGPEPVTYNCGGGITCAYGEDTIVTYRDPTEKYSVPAFVSKGLRDSMDVQDSYPS